MCVCVCVCVCHPPPSPSPSHPLIHPFFIVYMMYIGARSNATSILAKLSELCGYYDQMGDKTRELEGVAQQLEEVHKLASK